VECGLTLSELILRRLMGGVVTSRTEEETARSIDRLECMRKHLYPKNRDWTTAERRRRWWSLVTELRSTARVLRRSEEKR
jgi:hypothetical protein